MTMRTTMTMTTIITVISIRNDIGCRGGGVYDVIPFRCGGPDSPKWRCGNAADSPYIR
jgi:hypothetical protein